MNRAQRRLYNKRNHTHFTLSDFQTMFGIERLKNGEAIESPGLSKMKNLIHLDNYEIAPNGIKAKLNYHNVLLRPEEDLTDEFKEWVEENKDTEFHLSRNGVENSLVTFDEIVYSEMVDGNIIHKAKWLFDLYSDVLIFDGDDYKTVFEIEHKN